MYNCTMFIRVDNYSHYYNLKQHIQNNFNSLFPDKMRSNSYCILLIALFEITSTLSEPRSSQSRSLIPNSRRSRQSTSSTPDPPDPAAASEETERSQLQNGQEDLSVSESQLNPVSLINIKNDLHISPAEILKLGSKKKALEKGSNFIQFFLV